MTWGKFTCGGIRPQSSVQASYFEHSYKFKPFVTVVDGLRHEGGRVPAVTTKVNSGWSTTVHQDTFGLLCPRPISLARNDCRSDHLKASMTSVGSGVAKIAFSNERGGPIGYTRWYVTFHLSTLRSDGPGASVQTFNCVVAVQLVTMDTFIAHSVLVLVIAVEEANTIDDVTRDTASLGSAGRGATPNTRRATSYSSCTRSLNVAIAVHIMTSIAGINCSAQIVSREGADIT